MPVLPARVRVLGAGVLLLAVTLAFAGQAAADGPAPATGLSAGQDGDPSAAATPRVAAPSGSTRGSAALQRQVDALNAEIRRTSDALTAGATRFGQAQTRFEALTQQQFGARDRAEDSAQDSVDAQQSVDVLARAAYKGGMPPAVSAFLSGDPGSMSQLAYVQRSLDRVGRERADDRAEIRTRQVGAQAVLVHADVDRGAALAARDAVDAQLDELTRTADALTVRLTAAAAQLEAAKAKEQQELLAKRAGEERARLLAELAAAERRKAAAATTAGTPYLPGADVAGSGCQLPTGLEGNGFLSGAGLCPLSVGRGHRLRTDAALAFNTLNAAYQAQTGGPLCVTDSYRSFAEQVDVFTRKPGLAAVPGTSQHGWGLAVDFCGGIQTFGAPAHQWMKAHAEQFGWVHPPWAEPGGKRPEPWHWEYSRRS